MGRNCKKKTVKNCKEIIKRDDKKLFKFVRNFQESVRNCKNVQEFVRICKNL